MQTPTDSLVGGRLIRTMVLLADVVFLRTVKRGLRLANIDLHRDFARLDA